MKMRVVFIAALVIAAVVLLRVMRNPHPAQPETAQEPAQISAKKTLPDASSVAISADSASTMHAVPEDESIATTATAQVMRGDKSVLEARALDGEFERILVEPNEVLQIRLALNGFDASQPIRIDADNGGSLNRQLGPLVLSADKTSGAVEFQYAVGRHRGRYSLFITQGARQELMAFRVGPEPPTGQAGPVRHFNPDPS